MGYGGCSQERNLTGKHELLPEQLRGKNYIYDILSTYLM